MNKKIFWILLLVACSVFALLGIFHSGFFVSDDGHWMIIRLSAFYEGLSSGQFPVRFLPRLNQGLGYPVGDFLYPLFLYIGAVLHGIKIPFILDIKILLAGSVIFSGIGMYLFLRKHFSNFPAFLGGVVYIYLPYHLYDIYTRGSVGEVLALALAPFLFWSVEKKSWILLSIFLGLSILSHNTLALFFLPIIIVYAYLRSYTIAELFAGIGLGLGLSAFFYLPALYDRQFTIFNSVVVANPTSYFLNNSGYQLVGWIAVLIFAGSVFVRGFAKDKVVLFFFSLGILSLFLSSSLSSMLWKNALLLQFVQFPFRFLSITLISESFLAAYLMSKFNNKILPAAVILLLIGISAWAYLLPKQYDYHNDAYYSTNLATTTVQNEYMPRWVQKIPTGYTQQKVFIVNNKGSVENIMQKGTKMSFTISVPVPSSVQISYVYFPGWSVSIDGKRTNVVPGNPSGLVQFDVPVGTHSIIANYIETNFHLASDAVSLVSIGFILTIFLRKRIRSRKMTK